MQIEWYTAPVKPSPDYRLDNSKLTISDAGLTKIGQANPGFNDAPNVNLGWDAERQLIAIAPSEKSDKGSFKLSRQGRGSSRSVNVAQLFEQFGVKPSENLVEGEVQIEEGIALFGTAGIGAPVKKRRGPRRTTTE